MSMYFISCIIKKYWCLMPEFSCLCVCLCVFTCICGGVSGSLVSIVTWFQISGELVPAPLTYFFPCDGKKWASCICNREPPQSHSTSPVHYYWHIKCHSELDIFWVCAVPSLSCESVHHSITSFFLLSWEIWTKDVTCLHFVCWT